MTFGLKKQLITVVGQGGNRDKTKRPIMASIASELSDKVILTLITQEMRILILLSRKWKKVLWLRIIKVLAITDRKQAKNSVSISSAKRYYFDCGKGHETYQEINGVRHDFDDMKIVKEILEQLYK
jgi:UDP-N-acetylmuramoyl-L-alanyl-D-glutamate--2,6-diaminopimelate ligase